MRSKEHKEAVVQTILSGLGFDLNSEMGNYLVTDRRNLFKLPSATQRVICSSLDEVIKRFRLELEI
jgi:hypothetical protein